MTIAILKYSIGSLLYGGVITVLFLSLFIFLIKGWYKDAVFKPISFAILGILSLIILWNSTIICGAMAIKSDISSAQEMIENVIETSGLDLNSTVDSLQSNEVFQKVTDRHPILNYYADQCDFSGWTVAELPSVMCVTLKSYLNDIIIKRLLWTLAFVITGAIIAIKTLGRKSGGSTPSRNYGNRGSRNTGRTTPIASRHGGRRKPSRI